MTDELLRLTGLKVHFPIRGGFLDTVRGTHRGVIRAVDGIDLVLGRGEVLALVGESGSGKTTTGRVVVKLTRQTAGSIVFDGTDVSEAWGSKDLGDYRRRVQIIFQDPYETMNPKQSIFDFVAEPLVVNGIGTSAEREAKVFAALESAGLRPASQFAVRFPHELSGGQRQRVVIAGALVMDPDLIVADEPVSMLDVSIRTELLRLMLDLRRERGLAYLFITHDLSLAWVIADRIAVMYLGKIMEIGPAETVIRSPRNPYTQALVSVSPSPDPPDAGHAGAADHPRGRDARRRARADGLPLPSALPGGVRSVHGRGAAVVRPRGRSGGRLLAGRARGGESQPAASSPPTERPAAPASRGDHAIGRHDRDPIRTGDRHMTEPSALSPARIADLLAASAATVVAELVSLGDDGGWRPEPGEWSANECVGHLIEAERRGFAGRIRRILAADRPDIPADLESWDPPAVAEARRDHLRPAAELAAEFEELRADGVGLVRSLTAADMPRVGIHPMVGPLRVDELLGEWVHHDRNHIRQMLAVTQARVWAQMGNARRFSLEDL